MRTLGDLIQRPEPLTRDIPGATARERFLREPGLVILPVVEGGRPIGALSRHAFLARMEPPGAGGRTVGELMDAAPQIVPADMAPGALTAGPKAPPPTALLAGLLVVGEAGDYLGVVSALDLIAPAPEPAGADAAPGPLAARLGDALREPVADLRATVLGLRSLAPFAGAGGDLDLVDEAGDEILRLLDIWTQLDRSNGGLALSPRTHRLEDLMDDIEARWRRRAERRGLTLMVSYDGAPDCRAELDGGLFLQVFDALIASALAHARQGVVEASLKASAGDGGWLLACRVRDSGGRQDRAHADALGDAARSDDSAARAGVRMGMALAARIVAAMGGTLGAWPNPGAGMTKAFEVSVATAKPATAEEPAAPVAAQRIAHVLVVEDNATNRMVIETLCAMLGCSSESVVDGVEAVEAARAGRFDVILMDIKMPRMDGLTATAEIRKLPGKAGTAPIVALTANADPDDIARYLAAGMCRVVEKPIKADRFAEAITAALAGDTDAGRHAAAA